MPGRRAAVVAMSPLHADMIRRVLRHHTDITDVVELAGSAHLAMRLKTLDPDLVIIGVGRRVRLRAAALAATLDRARIVVVSRDARFVLEPGRKRPLTVACLVALAQRH